MRDKIMSHFFTIFLNSDDPELDGMIFNEDDDIERHIPGIKNIECKMNKFRIPYISSGRTDKMDMIFDHTCYGNIVVTNFKTEDKLIFIYIPEIVTNKIRNRIANILEELNDYDIHLSRKVGENFYKENIEDYVKNKQLTLTKTLQNKKINKKD